MSGERIYHVSRLDMREQEFHMRAWTYAVRVLSHPLAGSAETLAFLHLAAWAVCLTLNQGLLAEYRGFDFMHVMPQHVWAALTATVATIEAAGLAMRQRHHPDQRLFRRVAMFAAMAFFAFLGGSQLARDPGFPPAHVYLATATACLVAFLRIDELEREARDDASRGG